MQVLNDFNKFKELSEIEWLSDFNSCALKQSEKRTLSHDQVWEYLNSLEPTQGWLTLTSEIVVFDSFESFKNLPKDGSILNGEIVSSNGQISWHLRADISGELGLYELSESSGDTHIVKSQKVLLKSALIQNGIAIYRIYSHLDGNGQMTETASRFSGFEGIKTVVRD